MTSGDNKLAVITEESSTSVVCIVFILYFYCFYVLSFCY